MEIKERNIHGITILDLRGPLAFGEGEDDFREGIETLLEHKKNALLLNFEKVDFMDSSGVGALVTCLTHVTRAGGSLKGLRPNARVTKVLKITGVYNLIEFYNDEKRAIASF